MNVALKFLQISFQSPTFVYSLNLSGRVGLPFQDGTLTAEFNVVSVLPTEAVRATATILKAKKTATISAFVGFPRRKEFARAIFHRGFLISRRESARNLFTEDVAGI